MSSRRQSRAAANHGCELATRKAAHHTMAGRTARTIPHALLTGVDQPCTICYNSRSVVCATVDYTSTSCRGKPDCQAAVLRRFGSIQRCATKIAIQALACWSATKIYAALLGSMVTFCLHFCTATCSSLPAFFLVYQTVLPSNAFIVHRLEVGNLEDGRNLPKPADGRGNDWRC